MDVLIGVLAVAVGVLTGLVTYDMRQRGTALAKVLAAETKLEQAARAMADTHNSMATKLIEISDKVQGHELRLAGIGGSHHHASPNPLMARRQP
jgi:hypothetical protein